MKPTDFAIYLSKYFATYLPGQLGESINTVLSYRDTFALFLRYCKERENLPPEKLTLSQINANLIEGFLNWVEYERGCCVGTRNNRLAAIHAFYRYLQYELPEMLLPFQEILSIPFKKTQKKLISYLTLDGIKCLLAQPNKNTYSGLRDLCLLSLLYDTGARVQEIVDLKMEDVRLSYPTVIRLTGKGRKTRQVPIMKNTEEILRNYLSIHDSNYMFHNNSPLFCNRTGVKLTRAGISYIKKIYITS